MDLLLTSMLPGSVVIHTCIEAHTDQFGVLRYAFGQGLDESDEERKMENLYTGQGVGADEDGDDDEDEADGNVRTLIGVVDLLCTWDTCALFLFSWGSSLCAHTNCFLVVDLGNGCVRHALSIGDYVMPLLFSSVKSRCLR